MDIEEIIREFKSEFVQEHMPQGRAGNRWYTLKPYSWDKVELFLKQKLSALRRR